MEEQIKIIVVDDDVNLLFATARILTSAGYKVETAAGGIEGLEKIRAGRPDLVLLDVVMPDLDGVTVCRQIKSDPDLRNVYVILISSMKTETLQQADGLESGADGYIARPVDKRELLARVEAMIRIKRVQTALAESEARYRFLFTQMISGCALHEVLFDAYGAPCDYRFLDVNPAFERLTGLMREQVVGKKVLDILPDTEPLWIERYGRVALTGAPDHFESYSQSFDKYFEVLAYHIEKNQFAVTFTDITERKQAEEKLKYAALHDPLTALPNRRLFSDRLDQVLKKANRAGGQAAVLYLDLDYFKPVNDLYGHETGDRVLQEVARRIQACIRDADTVARIGGDEFVVILEGIENREAARKVARKITDSICEPISVFGHVCRVGASIGVSLYPADGDDSGSLLKIADHDMYEAKKGSKSLTGKILA